jgi:hypothetical protein
VFTSKKKPTSKRSQLKNTEEPSKESVLESSTSDSEMTSDIHRKFEIAERIYKSNPSSKAGQSFTVIDWLEQGGQIEDFASDKMKSYPLHVDHWNPDSQGYVPAER